MSNANNGLEIERKFLIARPDGEALLRLDGADYTDITQTYLLCEPGATERVRKRGKNGRFTYTHTIKRRLSRFTHTEDETEIDESAYNALIARADPSRGVIRKRRYTLPRDGHVFEIDVYPFWKKQAVMEVELSSEDESVSLPGEIRVLREVSGDRAYSNAGLALAVPEEDE